jgi:hypothetical protein
VTGVDNKPPCSVVDDRRPGARAVRGPSGSGEGRGGLRCSMMIGTHNHPEVGECHGTAIGEMLPLAIGSAISPTTITTTVLMLLSPTAMNRTLSLLVGCVVGVGGAVAFFAFLFTLLPTQDSGGLSSVARDYQACGRCVLLVLAVSQWRARPATGERAELPKWMTAVDSMTPGKVLVLGLLLSAVGPKNLSSSFSSRRSPRLPWLCRLSPN